jgi:hypothetical protein
MRVELIFYVLCAFCGQDTPDQTHTHTTTTTTTTTQHQKYTTSLYHEHNQLLLPTINSVPHPCLGKLIAITYLKYISGRAVAQLIKALCHKWESPGFDYRWTT